MIGEAHRCPHCDRLLDTAARLTAGECGCRWQPNDVILAAGRLWLAEWDRYAKRVEWRELVPFGRFANPAVPDGAVLVCRDIEGERLPVVALTDGDLFAVRTVPA